MTNKTLISIIIGIIVVCAAVAGYLYWQQTKPLKVTDEEIKIAQQQVASIASKEQGQATAPTGAKEETKDMDSCSRTFDEAKLKANSALNISNRQVEVSVKGFGKITLAFYEKDAPKTEENFLRITD